jgi:hypothetical protein
MNVLSPERIARGFRSPNLFLREANRLYHTKGYTRPYNTEGVDIFEEDWDHLIILDACRYDMFAEQADLPGILESRISRGSSTVEFLTANFANRNLRDTVYVTGNPQLYRHREKMDPQLHATIEVWQEDGWDEENKTVLPETMANRTLEAAERFPNKRIISHFIQPHYPFLYDEGVFDDSQAFLRPDEPGSWHQVMTGRVSASKESVWRAYRATLDRALPHVERLLENLDGRKVVSADHGNMIGERARPFPVIEWGHPRAIYTPELVNIPWHIQSDGERRQVESEPAPERSSEVESDAVKERLADLGYK